MPWVCFFYGGIHLVSTGLDPVIDTGWVLPWNIAKRRYLSYGIFFFYFNMTNGHSIKVTNRKDGITMKVKLDKNKFANIDNAFMMLKEDSQSDSPLIIIEENLKFCFGCDFDVNVVGHFSNSSTFNDTKLFVMSVFPEVSTMDKIISACMSDKDLDAIKKLWKENKKWTIEIDERIFHEFDFTPREYTAILLHEVGHIASSSSIPNRIGLILRYEIIKSSGTSKALIRDKVFGRLMSLPILDACISDGKRDRTSIAEEIKADAFAKHLGYSKELQSVLTKLIKSELYPNTTSLDDKIKATAKFSLSTLEDFQARKDKLVKKSLLSLKESCDSPYINSIIDEFIESVFEDYEGSTTFSVAESKVNYMMERAENDVEEYFKEAFIFGKKELKRIDPAELDYILVRTNQIKNENDKMMLLSYLHSKMDIVTYYMDILSSPKYSKKYRVPYTMEQLQQIKKELETMRINIINFKIPERNKNILVQWPSDYEG